MVPSTAPQSRGGRSRGADDSDLRDVTKPVCFGEQGRPWYAPREFVFRFGDDW
jgi:hypothetical protein